MRWTKALKLLITLVLLAALAVMRYKLRFKPEAPNEIMNYLSLSIADPAMAFLTVYFCFEFLSGIKGLSSVMEFVGKHSMNIFLVHTFFFSYYMHDFVYSFRYSAVITVVLLALSLGTSVIVEFLKKATRFDRLLSYVRSKI